MFHTLLPNVKELQKQFEEFCHQNSARIASKTNTDLSEKNGNHIIWRSILLEEFFLSTAKIAVPNILLCNETFISVKRNFVQRTVFLQYKNEIVPEEWENLYHFTNEEQFVLDAINPNEKLIKYTAFALFTETGKRKHETHNIFHLPKDISQKDNFIRVDDNVISSQKIINREGFDLTDSYPSQNTIDWNLGYCLYCHKRKKDSCSKGLDENKLGCPLRQDISESILLKKHNRHIAALAAIMRNNPLCILTGRRICNNCEEACIFQKQEAVDIQSVETQILNDVLTMPYGLEIYNTLLHWNPTSKNTYPNLQGKSVLIAGLGPAGLFASYLFAKTRASVLGIDALNIEITPKIQKISQEIILDASLYLNEPLSQRKPSGIGGVMEYGITARWNKNYLDILIGLLLRNNNIQFAGSRRIGGLLNYSDIFEKYKFNHVALCIGSATPKVPFHCKGLFSDYTLTKGVIMASDFLMSLHINRKSNRIYEITDEPVFVLGCGLTAIDTACEIRATLKQKGIINPDVTILYNKKYDKSSAYKINHLEFKKALEEGVKILQEEELIEAQKINGKLNALIFKNGKKLKCSLLVIAIGTQPNHAHIMDFINNEDVSLFGDCNPKYTGSVVNALASVRNGITKALTKTQANNNITQDINQITEIPLITAKESHQGLFEVKVQSKIFAEKLYKGNVLKLQEMHKDSIAITVCEVNDDVITTYLHDTNDATHSLLQAIMSGKTVHLNGINCNKLPDLEPDTVVVVSEKTRYIFEKIYKKNPVIMLPQLATAIYNNRYLIAIEDEKMRKEAIVALGQSSKDVIIYNKMNCMLGGVCGRCIMPNGKYACLKNIEEVLKP